MVQLCADSFDLFRRSFYSIKILPPLWQSISQVNPMLYVVNTFREGMLGISDVSITLSLLMMTAFIVIFS